MTFRSMAPGVGSFLNGSSGETWAVTDGGLLGWRKGVEGNGGWRVRLSLNGFQELGAALDLLIF